MALNYRADIDGLRAIAVISVVIFHAFPSILCGGFVGVDIFFVISGFLITSLPLNDLNQDKFSFIEFYGRRVRRLYPCLLIVLALSLAYGWLVLFPGEFKQLSKQALSSAFYLNNFTLYKESGYFDLSSEFKPLLHLWSLAIEEQFYLTWPFILWVAKRKSLPINKILLGILISSFFINMYKVLHNRPSFAFYMPVSRFWELLIGASLSYIMLYQRRAVDFFQRNYANLLSFLGVIFIVVAILILNNSRLFPGAWALLPTMGAFLIILSGSNAWINRNFLSSKPMVWVGLISYPLYLWHWPLLSFSRIIRGKELGVFFTLSILSVCVGLAFLTYRFLETPIRRHFTNKAAIVLLICMIPIMLVGLCGQKDLIKSRVASFDELDKITSAIGEWDYPGTLTKVKFKGRELFTCGKGQGKILFLGDSNMQQYAPRIQEIVTNLKPNVYEAVFLTAGGCPPLPGVYEDKHPETFWLFDTAVNYIERNKDVEIIVIGAAWLSYLSNRNSYYYKDALFQGSIELNSIGQQKTLSAFGQHIKHWVSQGKKVFIILNMPNLLQCDPRSMIKRYFLALPSVRISSLKTEEWRNGCGKVHDILKKIARAAKAEIIDPKDLLCDSAVCRVISDDGSPLYKDSGHLRPGFVRNYAVYIDKIWD